MVFFDVFNQRGIRAKLLLAKFAIVNESWAPGPPLSRNWGLQALVVTQNMIKK
jgi:hypothetical protein